MTSPRRKRWLIVAALLTAGSLVAGACGDDSGSKNGSATTTTAKGGASSSTTSVVQKATVAGCEKGYTDPNNLSATRQVARCTPGNPAPKPLAQKTKIRVSSSFRLEFNAPLLLANSLGEYAKENLEFEFVNLSFADAVPQLANGSIDAAVGGFEVALFNAGNAGLPVKVVMGNYFPPKAGDYTVPQTGLWCRRDAFSNPQDPNKVLKEIETKRWASSVGKGSSGIYYAAAEIQKRLPDFDIKKVTVDRIPSTDIVNALKNKAIDCGILLDPVWAQVKDDPNFWQAATQTPGEPLGIYAFGKSLLQDKPEVGEAFIRAFIRTVNTYFQGDYHSDAKVMDQIAKDTGQDLKALTALPSLTMDWEIRNGTTTRIQQLFIDLGVITDYKTPVAEDKLVDRSFYKKVLGVQ